MNGYKGIGLRRAGIRGLLALVCLTLQNCLYAEPSDSDIRRLEAKLLEVCGKPLGAYRRYYAYGFRSRDGQSATIDLGRIDAIFALDVSAGAHSYEIVGAPDMPAWKDKSGAVHLSFDKRAAVADSIVCADGRI